MLNRGSCTEMGFDPVEEFVRAVPTIPSEQFVSRSKLDNAPHVAAGADRDAQFTYGRPKDGMETVFHTQSVELLFLVPLAEPYDEVNLLSLANRSDPEELANVEYSETSNLDVVPKEVCRPTEDRPGGTPVASHDVVRDQSVTAHHELEGTLALANPALALEQDADPVDIDEHAVELRVRRQPFVEHRVQRVDGAARSGVGDKEGRARRLGRSDELARRVVPSGDENAREAQREVAARRNPTGFAVKRIEVRQLRFAQHLHASRHDPVKMPCQGESVLLHAGVPKGPIQARFPGKAAHVERELRVLNELANGQLGNRLAFRADAALLVRHLSSPACTQAARA